MQYRALAANASSAAYDPWSGVCPSPVRSAGRV